MKGKWKFGKEDKKIRFGIHKDQIKITTYYLWDHKAGLRIEVRRFTYTQTVEIELLVGDGVLTQKKIFKQTAFKNASKKRIDSIVEQYIQYAKDLGLIQKEIVSNL